MVSSIPDQFLAFAINLPWPANRIAFAGLRRLYEWQGRTGQFTRIRFKSVEIEAPLNHPAVFWRYRPAGANMNYLRLVRQVAAVRAGVVIDVGANIGDGVALLRGNGVDAPIFAIEGALIYADLMRKNVGHLGGVEIVFSLLTDVPNDNVLLATSKGTGAPITGASEVPVLTLEQVCDHHGVSDVSILKTDTDGYDAKVLRGARRILKDLGPVVFVEVDDVLLKRNGDSAEGLIRFIEDQGYEYIVAWDNDGVFVGSRSIAVGISDWTERFPGGPGTQFIDIAAFKPADAKLFEAVVVGEGVAKRPGG
jgi:FkbM family methyltransferase